MGGKPRPFISKWSFNDELEYVVGSMGTYTHKALLVVAVGDNILHEMGAIAVELQGTDLEPYFVYAHGERLFEIFALLPHGGKVGGTLDVQWVNLATRIEDICNEFDAEWAKVQFGEERNRGTITTRYAETEGILERAKSMLSG